MACEADTDDALASAHLSFAAQGLMRTLGAELTKVAPGLVEINYNADPRFSQQHGYMHAGLATAIVDTACGYAALTKAPAGHEVLTIEFKTNFMAPAKQPRFLARGRVVHAGRQVTVCEGRVFGLVDDHEIEIARMQATMMLIAPNDP